MKKSIKILLINLGIVIIAMLFIYAILQVNFKEEIIYSTTYYFAFGSRHIKIYENGTVYDCLEMEDSKHKHDYKYLKTLTKEEKSNLTFRLENESNREAIEDYVIELVYGVAEFDNFGNY